MSEAERVYKVVLFGVTGSGKSSIINILANKEVADVSTDADPCTKRARWYPISLGEKKFRLWDTMGFNPAEAQDIDPLSPYEQAHALLRNLRGGVDLILLCAPSRKDGFTASFRSLYWLLNCFFFGGREKGEGGEVKVGDGRVKIALVLTHFETISEKEQPDWWSKNMKDIAQKSGIPLQSLLDWHACITTVRGGSPQPTALYQKSKQALEALLEKVVDITPTPFPLDISSSDAAAESLKTYCRLSIHDATALVKKFMLSQPPLNVVLFGEAGVGKSSVVNLLLGHQKAEVSDGMSSCTMDFRIYEINAGLHQFQVWDTVGFNGTYMGDDMCWKAIENAVRLIRNLHDRGGIDLLVFCKRSGRLSPSELNSFRLFQEFLCEGQIPVSFVITHLEAKNPMGDWWNKNEEELLKACNMKPSAIAGHACITSLPPDPTDPKLSDKRSLSKQSLQDMLEDSISYGNVFDKDWERWIVLFVKRLLGMIRGGNPPKMTVNKLVDRCGLKREHAEELIKLFYTRG